MSYICFPCGFFSANSAVCCGLFSAGEVRPVDREIATRCGVLAWRHEGSAGRWVRRRSWLELDRYSPHNSTNRCLKHSLIYTSFPFTPLLKSMPTQRGIGLSFVLSNLGPFDFSSLSGPHRGYHTKDKCWTTGPNIPLFQDTKSPNLLIKEVSKSINKFKHSIKEHAAKPKIKTDITKCYTLGLAKNKLFNQQFLVRYKCVDVHLLRMENYQERCPS